MSLISPQSHPHYHPVIRLPNTVELYDFSQGYDPNRRLLSPFGIGKYNEHRPGMYTGDLFETEARTIHMGIDIGAPIGTPVYAFDNGTILHRASIQNLSIMDMSSSPNIMTTMAISSGFYWVIYPKTLSIEYKPEHHLKREIS